MNNKKNILDKQFHTWFTRLRNEYEYKWSNILRKILTEMRNSPKDIDVHSKEGFKMRGKQTQKDYL